MFAVATGQGLRLWSCLASASRDIWARGRDARAPTTPRVSCSLSSGRSARRAGPSHTAPPPGWHSRPQLSPHLISSSPPTPCRPEHPEAQPDPTLSSPLPREPRLPRWPPHLQHPAGPMAAAPPLRPSGAPRMLSVLWVPLALSRSLCVITYKTATMTVPHTPGGGKDWMDKTVHANSSLPGLAAAP